MEMKNNFENNTPDISSIDTRQITSLLEDYNKRFSMGATLARAIVSDVSEKDFEEEDFGSGIHEQQADELLTSEQLKNELSPILEVTGLELQPINAKWGIAGSGISHEGVEMRLNLKDGKIFASYLQSLSPETLTESQKAGLKDVSRILLQQFKGEYDLENPNDERLIELMGSLSNIISEYKRLNINESFDSIPQLETYLSVARKGYLREYRQAENLLLTKPFSGEGFSLRWHIDASPVLLNKNWSLVIDTLKFISDNDNARNEIYSQAISTANDAIDSGIKEVSEWEEAESGYYAKKQEFLDVLKSVKARLADF